MKIVSHEQGTPAWLRWRKSGIGGSDAAAIRNKSPYMTAYELFMDKTSRSVKKDESDSEFIFSRGHATEEMLRGEIFALTGKHMTPICVEHPVHDFQIASLDGYYPDLGILEAKLVGKKVLEDIKAGIIPAHHFIQVQHAMAATDEVDVTRYFAHDMGQNGVLLEIKADKEFQKKLTDDEFLFWERIKRLDPPPLTDDDFLIPEDLTDFKAIKKLKAKLDKAQAEYDAIADKLKNAYKHPKVSGAGVRITSITRTGNINYKSIPEIKKLDEEYLEKFRGKASTYKQISFED